MKTKFLFTAAALSILASGAFAADLNAMKAGAAAKATEVAAPVTAKVEEKKAAVAAPAAPAVVAPVAVAPVAAASAAPAEPAASSTSATVKHHIKTTAKAAKDAATEAVTK